MLHILYGPDDFSLRQAIEKIKAELGDSEMLAVNTSKLDGLHLTLNELRNQCGAAPFLSSHRLVVVNGLLGLFEKKQRKSPVSKGARKSQNKLGEWQDIDSCIKQIPETTVLILIDGKIDAPNPLLKKLLPLAEVKRFPFLTGEKLETWIKQRVINKDGNITLQAVSLIADLIGGDLWAVDNEIQKLVLYCQGRSIGLEDVRQLVGYSQETSIFPLVDAVIEGKSRVAQRLLHQMHQEGASPTTILSMITRQFRLIALAKDLEPGLSYQQIRDRLNLNPKYPLSRLLAQARLYSFEGIKQAYDKLLETDLAIKTGKYKTGKHDDQLAIELLVAELTGSLA